MSSPSTAILLIPTCTLYVQEREEKGWTQQKRGDGMNWGWHKCIYSRLCLFNVGLFCLLFDNQRRLLLHSYFPFNLINYIHHHSNTWQRNWLLAAALFFVTLSLSSSSATYYVHIEYMFFVWQNKTTTSPTIIAYYSSAFHQLQEAPLFVLALSTRATTSRYNFCVSFLCQTITDLSFFKLFFKFFSRHYYRNRYILNRSQR